MDTRQLEKILSTHLQSTFHGVFALDEIPKSRLRPLALIVNTDPSTRDGRHWTAVYLHTDNRGEYFDSFGRPPSKTIQQYLSNNATSGWEFNQRQVQGLSTLCGGYCVQYLEYRHQHQRLMPSTVVNRLFPHKDYFENDFLVQLRLKKHYNIRVPIIDETFVGLMK